MDKIMNAQKTILLVEDEALIAVTEKRILQKYGYHVITVSDGKKATEKVRETHDIDLILMDIDLGKGKMDGTEAAEIILKERSVPILFLSSHIEPEITEKTERITSYGYVVKDSGETVLIASIKMAFRLYEAHRRLKEREEALEISELKYRTVADFTHDWEYWIGSDGALLYTSPSCESITGYGQEEFMKDPSLFAAVVHPEDRPLMVGHQGVPDSDAPHFGDFRIITRNGKTKWLSHRCRPVFDREGRWTGFRGSNRDITERKKAEYALRESERRFTDIIQFLPDATFVIDRDGKVIAWNRGMEEMAGVGAEDMLGRGDYAYAVPFYGKPRPILIDLVLARNPDLEREYGTMERRGNVYCTEVFVPLLNNGKDAYLWATASKLVDMEGNIAGAIESVRDITDNKRMEAEAAACSAVSQIFLQSVSLNIICQRVAEALVATLRFPVAEIEFYDPARGEMIFVGMAGIPGISKGLCVPVHETLAGTVAVTGDVLCETHAGRRKEYQFRQLREVSVETFLCVPLLVDEEVFGTLAVADWRSRNDAVSWISNMKTIAAAMSLEIERKLAEEQVKSILAEKEILLREVHHRIKNHVNAVMSLLSLKAGSQKDPVLRAALYDTRNRLQSMSVLYDKLYRSDNLKEMPSGDYLKSLVREIIETFPTVLRIRTEITVDDFILPVETLSHIGIIINELVTNSMKHAFPGRDEGFITLSASKNDNHVTLTVADNGIGLPETTDLENHNGFGLQLLQMLTEQLEGTIRIERDKGSRFILNFDI
jgi:PAS domain S-box-containing protein